MNDANPAIDPATERFRSLLPHVILSVSPHLSAEVKSRFDLQQTEVPFTTTTSQEFCPKCGYFLFLGDSQTRSLRIRTKSRPTDGGKGALQSRRMRKVKRTVCGRCGHFRDMDLLVDAAPSFIAGDAKATVPSNVSIISPISEPLPPPNVAPISNTPTLATHTTASSRGDEKIAATPTGGSGKRSKKKSVLQEMISKSRQQESQANKKKETAGGIGGLADFLNGL